MALRAARGFAESQLVVFCDGPRTDADAGAVVATREVARELSPPGTRFVFHECNNGLRRSIVAGVGTLLDEFGTVIVIEDDLRVAEGFLEFMNAALDHYADDEKVMQVSGHQFPVVVERKGKSMFLPLTTTWGWATWHRAWQHFDPDAAGYQKLLDDPKLRKRFDLDGSYPFFKMLQMQRDGLVDSWGILWYLSVFVRGGLVLFPPQALVKNEGFDGSGTHSNIFYEGISFFESVNGNCWKFPNEVVADEFAFSKVKKYLSRSSSVLVKFVTFLKAKLTNA